MSILTADEVGVTDGATKTEVEWTGTAFSCSYVFLCQLCQTRQTCRTRLTELTITQTARTNGHIITNIARE